MLNFQDDIFLKYLDLLKNISYNKKAKEFLTESTLLAVDFDRYTEDMYRGQNTPSSVDALYSAAVYNYLIEFKGGKAANIKEKALRKKNRDSITTLIDKAGESEENIKTKYIYVLVFTPENDPERGIGASLGSLADERFFAFGLDAFIGNTFLDVHTISAESFNNDFIPQHFIPSH